MAIAIVANGTHPLAPMAIVTTIGTTDLIAIGAIGTSI
jgi:hypothetical protein